MPIFDGVQGSILSQLLQAIVPNSMGTPDEQLMNALGMNRTAAYPMEGGYPNQPMQPGQPGQPGQPPQPYAQPGQPSQPSQPAQVPQGGGQSYPVQPPSASAGQNPGPFSWNVGPMGQEPESAVPASSFVSPTALPTPSAPRSVVTGRPSGPMYQTAPQPQQLPAEAIAQPNVPAYPQPGEMSYEDALARANQAVADRMAPGGLAPLSPAPPPPELQFDRYGTLPERNWTKELPQPGVSRIPPAIQQAVNTAPQPGRSKRELVLGLINMLSQAQQGYRYGASRMNPIWEAQQRQEQDWQMRVENDKIRKENERYDRAQREWESDPARQVAKQEILSRAQRDFQEETARRQRAQRLDEGTRIGLKGRSLDQFVLMGTMPAPQQINNREELITQFELAGDYAGAERIRKQLVEEKAAGVRPFAPAEPDMRQDAKGQWWERPKGSTGPYTKSMAGTSPLVGHVATEGTGTWQESVNDQGLVFDQNTKSGELKIKIDPTTGKQMKRKLPGAETSSILSGPEEDQVKEGVHNQIMAEFSEKYPGFLFMGGSQGGPQSHQAEYYKRYQELYPRAYQALLDRKNPAARQQRESDAMAEYARRQQEAIKAARGTKPTPQPGAPATPTPQAAPSSAAPAKPEAGIWDKTKSIATDAMDKVLQAITGVQDWNAENQRRAEEYSQEMQRRRAEQK